MPSNFVRSPVHDHLVRSSIVYGVHVVEVTHGVGGQPPEPQPDPPTFEDGIEIANLEITSGAVVDGGDVGAAAAAAGTPLSNNHITDASGLVLSGRDNYVAWTFNDGGYPGNNPHRVNETIHAFDVVTGKHIGSWRLDGQTNIP